MAEQRTTHRVTEESELAAGADITVSATVMDGAAARKVPAGKKAKVTIEVTVTEVDA